MTTKTAMSLQEIKDKIDGYHRLQADGHLSEGDCGDAICDLIGGKDGPNALIYDDAFDYVGESYLKFFNLDGTKVGLCS